MTMCPRETKYWESNEIWLFINHGEQDLVNFFLSFDQSSNTILLAYWLINLSTGEHLRLQALHIYSTRVESILVLEYTFVYSVNL